VGWLHRFCELNSFLYKTVCGEEGDARRDVVSLWEEKRLNDVIKQYSQSDLYNAIEVPLFYKLMMSKTPVFEGEWCIGT
jgi:hypothetical protein